MRSSAPRGSDSARWMPRASSRVRVAARRHAVSVTASGTRMLGSSSLVRPKSRRIGEALTWRLSTHAMRCGSTQPCTDGAMTGRLCALPRPSGRPAGVVRPLRASSRPQWSSSRVRHSTGTEFRACQSHIGGQSFASKTASQRAFPQPSPELIRWHVHKSRNSAQRFDCGVPLIEGDDASFDVNALGGNTRLDHETNVWKPHSRRADTRLMLTLSKALFGRYSCVMGTPPSRADGARSDLRHHERRARRASRPVQIGNPLIT